jgi:hypothetical protein
VAPRSNGGHTVLEPSLCVSLCLSVLNQDRHLHTFPHSAKSVRRGGARGGAPPRGFDCGEREGFTPRRIDAACGDVDLAFDFDCRAKRVEARLVATFPRVACRSDWPERSAGPGCSVAEAKQGGYDMERAKRAKRKRVINATCRGALPRAKRARFF